MNDMCPTCGRCQACGSKGDGTGMTIFSVANVAAAAPQPTVYMETNNNAAAAQSFKPCEHVRTV